MELPRNDRCGLPNITQGAKPVTELTATQDEINPQGRYTSLRQPGMIGELALKNRLIMAAMGNALADDKGNVSDAMLEYYRARARGGVGMVITQFAAVSPDDIMPYNLSLCDDEHIAGFNRLMQTIHESGAKACIQLMHPGMLFLLFKTMAPGKTIKVPDLTPGLPKDRPLQVVGVSDIERYVSQFGEAAGRAIKAGADAVEIHACHGCLLSTFLSPAMNRRTDEYGGNVENRVRFVRQIVENIRRTVGPQFPLIVRINGSDDVPEGVTPDDVVQQARVLSEAGVSAISISSGMEYWSTLMAPSYLTPHGVMLPAAAEVKKRVRIPVITAGKIDPDLAEKSVKEGRTDFIALGRPLLADPELPNKLFQINHEERVSCLYCNNCLRTSWRSCTVNPFLYRETTARLTRTGSPKKIMVIGGGLAGMEVAVLCKMRGHDVSLFEKEKAPGGQWKVACSLPGKEGYLSLLQHLAGQLNILNVPVNLNTTVNRRLVEETKPDVAIVATGAIPLDLDIPGASENNCVQANDVITGRVEAGRMIVIGGSMAALETAVSLAQRGKTVTLVSHSALGGRKGPDDMITFRGLLRKIIALRIPLYLNSEILEIKGGSLVIRYEQEMLSLPFDTIVLAAGVKAADGLINELKGVVAEIYPIGDCVLPGNAAQATYSALRLALKL
jgi:2,4-dienoyl-CoA reductase-like NADH-dependent reductase (Old Yellow Enzyme family)/thioredoxin reductase